MRLIVSPQDFPPASYPLSLYRAGGAAETPSLPQARFRDRYWVNALLFLVTLASTTIVGASMQVFFDRNLPFDLYQSFSMYPELLRHPSSLSAGLPFSLTLLTILLAHEFGHYIAALRYGVNASLPYFMPSPGLGTFGAFIRLRSPICSKRALFDIGIAGPLAGFVFLLPALSIGLAFSKVIPGIAHQGSLQFGVPALQWLFGKLIFPGVAASDINLHPAARAAWVGMLATALNLLPIGQLDGGHIVYACFPRRHAAISLVLSLLLLPLGAASFIDQRDFWSGWLFWGLVLLVWGRRHPMVYDSRELDSGRNKLALLALVVFLLCFMLVPAATGGL
ncbi:MAG: site-2 protease family protein [Bryobacteraceae bacterium]